MNVWQLYPTVSAAMPFQMALDDLLLQTFIRSQPDSSPAVNTILRFFYSSEPWVTVGYSYRDEVNTSDGRVCRRITGGGKVHHGQDLIFSIIGRKEHDDSFKSVRLSYWKIHESVKQGYEMLGCKPRFYRADENLPAGSDCFRFPIATDLSYRGQKIAGGAQKRSQGVFLHQESLSVPRRLTSEHLVKAVTAGFSSVFKISFEDAYVDAQILDDAKILMNSKYPNLVSAIN